MRLLRAGGLFRFCVNARCQEVVVMNRYLVIVTAFLLASCGMRGGESGTSAAGEASVAETAVAGHTFDVVPGDTLIAVKLGVIDLGRMREGEMVCSDFSLVNRCGKPIVILDVKGSCGCVGLDADLRPFADGEAKRVAMSYDSKGKEGRQTAVISVKTSAGDYKIELKADVKKQTI